MIADVVFPLRLMPLTYRLPREVPEVLEGRIVRAPLGRRTAFGVVVSVRHESADGPALKEIEGFSHLFGGPPQMSLLKWLSEYYLTPMGVALRSMFFQEAAACAAGDGSDAGGTRGPALPEGPDAALQPQGETVQPVVSALGKGEYAAFLYPARSRADERDFLLSLLDPFLSGLRGAAILVPEIGQIEPLASVLRETFGERLAVLHSRLPKGRRKETVRRLMEGTADIVIGTRSAVLGPLRRLSLIAVLGEHSRAFKAEEGLRYHGRDVAVMRGYLEKACVVLSSFCPSLESSYNARAGKYTLLKPAGPAAPGPRRVVVGIGNTAAKGLAVSPQVLKNVREVLSRQGRFLFLVHRKGYSYIKCRECRGVILCPACEVPVVFQQTSGSVRCRRCGYEKKAPEDCPTCGGTGLAPLGAGTERVTENVKNLLGTDVQVVEKGRGRGGRGSGVSGDSGLGGLVVGTPYAVRRLGKELFGGAVVVSLDHLLSQPDFRSHEKAFQEVLEVAQMVAPEGRIFLQTWAPRSRIVRQIAACDYQGFYEQEIAQRRELGYPPLTRLVLVAVSFRGDEDDSLRRARSLAAKTAVEGVETLGPAPAAAGRSGSGATYHLLLKSRDRRALHRVARDLLSGLAGIRGAKTIADVDPLEV